MSSQFSCSRAIFKVVPYGAAQVDAEALLSTAFPEDCAIAMVGYLRCPRGCGAIIYWALSPEMIPYKKKFLTFLNQQLCWTPCPLHAQIEDQRSLAGLTENMARLPASTAIMSGSRRYRNSYE